MTYVITYLGKHIVSLYTETVEDKVAQSMNTRNKSFPLSTLLKLSIPQQREMGAHKTSPPFSLNLNSIKAHPHFYSTTSAAALE